MRPVTFLLLAASGLAGSPGRAAPIPKHLMKEATEQDKLQGRWKANSIRIGGRAAGPPKHDLYLEILGDDLTGTTSDGGFTAKLKLDTADGLKRLTLTSTRRFDRDGKLDADEANTTIANFGYVLDGDHLKMASDLRGGETGKAMDPATDPAKPGNDLVVVFALTRVKPAPEK